LARELEVSSKSIQRDLDFKRDRFGLPIEYDGGRFGYFYTEPVSSFPALQITEGELFALMVAE
jgi:predicted DNA-binding transcriptional regulator YafY